MTHWPTSACLTRWTGKWSVCGIESLDCRRTSSASPRARGRQRRKRKGGVERELMRLITRGSSRTRTQERNGNGHVTAIEPTTALDGYLTTITRAIHQPYHDTERRRNVRINLGARPYTIAIADRRLLVHYHPHHARLPTLPVKACRHHHLPLPPRLRVVFLRLR